MSKPLFDASDESENDNEIKLGTNEEYAKSFNSFRKKELLKKLKDRGYNNVTGTTDSSDDSESSDEDEDNLDENFDRQFFKTLASLKSKDPAIYDKNTQFFENSADEAENENDASEKSAKKANKPVTLKDYERKVIVEHGGRFEDESDAESADETSKRPASPTVVEEERRLKAEFKQVLEADDSADEEFGGIFSKRIKNKEEETQEEADFTEWLAGKKAQIEASTKQKLEPLKNYWNQRNLPQSERFLRDYILSKGYSNTKSADIPTYEEIVGEDVRDAARQAFSDDENELEKQAEFEEKYNFRFEDPDQDFIKRYPRTVDSSVRQTAGKRKEKRQELKERKQAEKEEKMKEIEMLKEMKRKEIEEKIEKLKRVTGNDELGFKDDELEEDFDPEAHDKRMRELFNDEYYQVDEGEDKPECPSDIDELKVEDWDNYDPQHGIDGDDYEYNEVHCEDDDFNMDCDYDPAAAKQQFQQELIDNTKKRKNRRGRRNRFMEMIQQDKPTFDPEDERTYGEYIDEYYKMDCEDIIADIPCRFKYVETTPNDFGLTIEEILLAKNKELNQWASLKKALQIRPDQVEKRDQKLYKMKAKNEALKRKIFKSLYGEHSDDENDSDEETKTDNKEATAGNEANSESQKTTTHQNIKKKKKPKKKRKNNKQSTELMMAAAEGDTKVEEKKVETAAKEESSSSQVGSTIAVQKQVTSTESATTNGPNVNAQKKKRKNKRKNNATNKNTTNVNVNNNEPAAKKLKLSEENENASIMPTIAAAVAINGEKNKKQKKNKKHGIGQPNNTPSKQATEISKQNAKASNLNENVTNMNQARKCANPFGQPVSENDSTNKPTTTAATAAINGNKNNKKNQQKQKTANKPSMPSATPIKQNTNPTSSSSENAQKTTNNPFYEQTSSENNASTTTTTNQSKENPFKAARKAGEPKLFANDEMNGGKSRFNSKFKSKFDNKSKPKFKPFNNKSRKPFGGGVRGGRGGGGRTTNAGQVKINDDRLKAYNINPRKFHKKQKFGGSKGKTNAN